MLLIYLINDLQMSRKELLHQLYRPALQGFWEHCVVGVCEGLPGDLPRLRERGGLATFLCKTGCPTSAHPMTRGQKFPQLPPVCNRIILSACIQLDTPDSIRFLNGPESGNVFFTEKKKAATCKTN